MTVGDANACPKCGRAKKPAFPTCWKCAHEHEITDAFARGVEHGRAEATRELARARPPGVVITLDTWRRLASLCHPDRHGGSRAATLASQWLNEIRAQVAS